MLPMRTQTIFKSRWWAVVWAVGILWTVHDFVGVGATADANTVNGAESNVSDDAQIAALSNTVNNLRAQ